MSTSTRYPEPQPVTCAKIATNSINNCVTKGVLARYETARNARDNAKRNQAIKRWRNGAWGGRTLGLEGAVGVGCLVFGEAAGLQQVQQADG